MPNLEFRSTCSDIPKNLSPFFCVPELSALPLQSIIFVVVAQADAVLSVFCGPGVGHRKLR